MTKLSPAHRADLQAIIDHLGPVLGMSGWTPEMVDVKKSVAALSRALTDFRDEHHQLRNQRDELTAAWREAFGLVVCRSGSKADIETVNRFWVMMNRAAGTGA